jgi:hypothetical protein
MNEADTAAANGTAMRLAALLGIQDCQVEAGSVGFVLYGPSPERSNAAGRAIAKFLERDLKKVVVVEGAVFERDEQPAHAWVVTVRFAW